MLMYFSWLKFCYLNITIHFYWFYYIFLHLLFFWRLHLQYLRSSISEDLCYILNSATAGILSSALWNELKNWILWRFPYNSKVKLLRIGFNRTNAMRGEERCSLLTDDYRLGMIETKSLVLPKYHFSSISPYLWKTNTISIY